MRSWHWTQIPGRLPEVLLPSELSHWPYRQLSSPGFKQKSQLWTLWSWLTFSKPQLWQNPVVFIIETFGWYQIAGMPLLYFTFLGRCWGHRGKWSRVIAFFLVQQGAETVNVFIQSVKWMQRPFSELSEAGTYPSCPPSLPLLSSLSWS